MLRQLYPFVLQCPFFSDNSPPVYLQYKYCGVAPVEVVKLISTAGSPDVWITTEHRER